MTQPAVSYKRHRFPPQIIAHAVWLYYRFPLSLRLVEVMLLERGITVSYENGPALGIKFGPSYPRRLRRKQPSRSDVWHLDEIVMTIAGGKCWLWRAVDQEGHVLDEIVQNRRNTKAARRLPKKQGIAPKHMITGKLAPMEQLGVKSCRSRNEGVRATNEDFEFHSLALKGSEPPKPFISNAPVADVSPADGMTDSRPIPDRQLWSAQTGHSGRREHRRDVTQADAQPGAPPKAAPPSRLLVDCFDV